MADYCIAYQQIASREGQQTIVGNRFLQLWDRPLSRLRTFFLIFFLRGDMAILRGLSLFNCTLLGGL